MSGQWEVSDAGLCERPVGGLSIIILYSKCARIVLIV